MVQWIQDSRISRIKYKPGKVLQSYLLWDDNTPPETRLRFSGGGQGRSGGAAGSYQPGSCLDERKPRDLQDDRADYHGSTNEVGMLSGLIWSSEWD